MTKSILLFLCCALSFSLYAQKGNLENDLGNQVINFLKSNDADGYVSTCYITKAQLIHSVSNSQEGTQEQKDQLVSAMDQNYPVYLASAKENFERCLRESVKRDEIEWKNVQLDAVEMRESNGDTGKGTIYLLSGGTRYAISINGCIKTDEGYRVVNGLRWAGSAQSIIQPQGRD